MRGFRAQQEVAHWGYKYGYVFTPNALIRHIASIDQVYTLSPFTMILVGIDPDHGPQFRKLAPAACSVGVPCDCCGTETTRGGESDNGKGADNSQDPARCSAAMR
ncbi:hypothetical protein F5141DRAFT_488657 [Pisolithus sp. B1]|nr:hypothetical protein F5141DRAFT_560004 [Pisolithus sp. B1]KAI6096857.1 hypothetical protein F5141DRAFT_488657 [Pisolithus sp. B1]